METIASASMASLEEMNAYLAAHSFLGSDVAPVTIDFEQWANIRAVNVDVERMPHLSRWHAHVSHLERQFRQGCVLSGHAPQPKESHSAVSPRRGQSGGEGPSHFCILDFEKTCQDRDIDPNFAPQEIIEFPSVLLVRGTSAAVAEFQSFVKPCVHPMLTPFCTQLTGIAQQQVDTAHDLPAVLTKHHAWLRDIVPQESDCVFVTCGDMDLKRSLPDDPNVPKEVPDCYRKWINIKKAFGSFYTNWYKKGKQPRNMLEMMEKLDIALDGKHHSGIDDCRNIAKVVQRMISAGWTPSA